MPFCTSHSSGIGSSADNLHDLSDEAKWGDGRRFGAETSRRTIEEWIGELELTKANVFDN